MILMPLEVLLTLKAVCCVLIGQVLANTIQGDKEDVDLAVKTARKAYESWSKTPPHVRARHMYR